MTVHKFIAVLVGALLLCGIAGGCLQSQDLSDEDIDRIAERVADLPPNDALIKSFVDALLQHPRYIEYLEDDEWVVEFTNAMMVHPLYQTTPQEDCATTILMAAVIAQTYELPPASSVDALCDWYLEASE